ncbi:NAD(P)-dependent oxidoreductase [Marinomonas foliarum]|uniref:Lactate dehydrogenase-like 2-hydroxyacid dehydrogenase n=1 Tax=Marinomonas foliarum TaxID=491950 RepID=A0A369A417_9GAMM|nr:NAD(P)-dependent oxidoreductase [Marinomonas foliarum]RCX02194.1 lactate dehydrogenase-like 2-hydroxyacid dehydrogenase [Marinomonas foliarum]
MTSIEQLKAARASALSLTQKGAPQATSNQFFGVGPITDMTLNEVDARQLRFEFDAWIEENYPKLDDKGNRIGSFTTAEIGRGMHRGYPADKVLNDMMREIHRYFGFPKANRMAVGLGGGHSGFTAAALHLMTANDASQIVYVDTPKPESAEGKAGGFFRQSWGTQLTELQRYATNGDENRIIFAEGEGAIPSADFLIEKGVKLFFGVGHETTGATTYTEQEIANLLAWIDANPEEHHAVIDATSLLGAMPWAKELVDGVLTKCNLFMPFQKAIGGISGYFIVSLTKPALALINANQKDPSWAIPRQLKIAVPRDAKEPLTSEKTTDLGPIYDAEKDQMLGGIINTFSTLAFAETTFAILRNERMIGDVYALNARSAANRQSVDSWIASSDLFELGVSNADSRGAAVTLLKVTDGDITDADVHARIIAKSKQMLGYEGITHTDGAHEKGLDVARYVNAFPGTPGDYRAWIGGIRPSQDITALLENIQYCYLRAKNAVLEELLAEQGESFESAVSASAEGDVRVDDANRAYKVLIADLVGMVFDADGNADCSEVAAYIKSKGGEFHFGSVAEAGDLAKGKVHFFYQPSLSREDELLAETGEGQYDAVIAAATFFPAESKFELGGVRIGAGTGNMGSASWGGGNGEGGVAPLMNTPSFNSRATAQAAMKALLKVLPDLQVSAMHDRVVAGDFDTGKNLAEFPTTKLEGKKLAVVGYGNIGREVAKLGAAFGMKVSVYARPAHQKWIESEGFTYASSIVEAAQDADVLSPHTGLGAFNADTGKFSNSDIINADVFSAMKQGAVLVNYDRGEVVDIEALDAALASGQIRYAAIDADLFKDPATGELSGPMVPYRNIYEKHVGKMELLPHAAADTEHVSRVEGAKQAVDQILSVIQHDKVINLKGDLPKGFTNGGTKTVNGVGKVNASSVKALSAEQIKQLADSATQIAAYWGAINATEDTDKRAALVAEYSEMMVLNSNIYTTLLAQNGLQGPLGN